MPSTEKKQGYFQESCKISQKMRSSPRILWWKCLTRRHHNLHAPILKPVYFSQKSDAEARFSQRNSKRTRSRAADQDLHFRVRKALPTLHFLNEIVSRISIFCQKTEETTAFSVQNSKKNRSGLSGISQHRDLANPLAFQPLSL